MASTVTFTVTKKDVVGTDKVAYVDMDVTNYEQAGNIPITAGDVGLARLTDVTVVPEETSGVYGVFDGTSTITLYNVSDALEAADATDHGVFRLVVRGK